MAAKERRDALADLLLTSLYEGIRLSSTLVESELLTASEFGVGDLQALANFGRLHLPQRGIYTGVHNRTRIWLLDPKRESKFLSESGNVGTNGYSDASALDELNAARAAGTAPGPSTLTERAAEGRMWRRRRDSNSWQSSTSRIHEHAATSPASAREPWSTEEQFQEGAQENSPGALLTLLANTAVSPRSTLRLLPRGRFQQYFRQAFSSSDLTLDKIFIVKLMHNLKAAHALVLSEPRRPRRPIHHAHVHIPRAHGINEQSDATRLHCLEHSSSGLQIHGVHMLRAVDDEINNVQVEIQQSQRVANLLQTQQPIPFVPKYSIHLR